MAKQQRMDKNRVKNQGVDDLVLLSKITEDQIVENLAKRYQHDLIYTNIGPVLIAVNPFRNLGISGDDYVQMYNGKFRHELPPHIFALAEEAYRTMKNEKESQCVIISGESGAGKTESAKLIMQYIAAVSGNSAEVAYVKRVILESNPLLEAFGNAKTLRNNNSSRFGKYFEIRFDRRGDPCGGVITNYLLEKSRVVFQTPGERSFHIFYFLLAGATPQEQQQWQLYAPEHFHYLNQSGCTTVEGLNDAAEFQEVRQAMAAMNMTAEEQANVLQTTAAILHLGNVGFVEDAKGNAAVADEGALELAASLLQVDPFALKNALLFRVIQTGGPGGRTSTYNVPQNVEQATAARDSLAKTIYSRQFDWIVQKVNQALERGSNDPEGSTIGVLDIYGFEIFQKNSFEQFCINYVNEKLQQYFIELTLKAEQEEYVREGITWTPIKYFNNQIVCDLIEGKKPPGIFSVLDDICATVHATSDGVDAKFLGKMSGQFNGHLHYRGFDRAFAIKHYAGEVTYDIEGFTEKNRDTLFADLIEAMQTSSMAYLVGLFPENTKQDGMQKKRPTTAGFKIRNSAAALMTTLSRCNPHYIRCIKPNETKRPKDWDQPRVQHQVQYLGLLENVRVRRAGFAYRAEFARFLKRYKKLSRATWGVWGEFKGNPADGCRTILEDLQLDSTHWQLGKTKVFIRFPETLFHLEELLSRKDYECTLRIQKAWRQWKLRKHALEQRAAAADLLRGKKERRQESVARKFEGDYIHYDQNYLLQDAIKAAGAQGEHTVFADQVVKLNRRCKAERRDFVVTNMAFYFAMRQKKRDQITYKVTRRTELRQIAGVSLSTLSDNYVCIHMNGDSDNLFENDKKTELVIVLSEYYKMQTGADLRVNFTDTIQYKVKGGDVRTASFSKNEAAATATLKKAGKNLTISIKSGLPKDTDTTPHGFTGGGSARPTGRGGGAGRAAGGAAARSGGAAPGPAAGAGRAQPAAGRAAPQPTPSNGGAAGTRTLPQPTGAAGGAGRAQPAPTGGARVLPQPTGAAAGAGRTQPAATGGGAGRAQPSAGAQPAAGAGGARTLPQPTGAGRAQPTAGAGGARAPPRQPPRPKARALYDYDASTDDELSFRENDILFIVQKDPGGWWEGELPNGKRGWIPANYVQEI